MDKKELYAEYEKLLLGKKRNLPSSFWDQNPTISYQNALTIIQYAVEKLLKWTPSDVANALTLKTMHMMKLHTLLKYLNVPDVYESGFDARYIAHILYPREISYSHAQATLEIYQRIISDKACAYPKRFFHDESGVQRAKICLSFVLRNKLFFSSIEDMYSRFASSEGQKIMAEYHLLTAATLFETLIDYLHQSLSEAQRDDYLYNYYKFQIMYRQQKRIKEINN